ncbi:MAG: tRNA (adenosine(37)-N6)-threonylcarbamoyltransferase complex dimerization subunit type 1 TsaB, partial [Endomicrobiia bacterium]
MDKKYLNYTILSLDTSTKNLSMCLYKNGKFYEENIQSEDHSENLTKILDKILKKTKTKLNQITHLLVNIGPGSFTGLRIGLSFVKTLALNLN